MKSQAHLLTPLLPSEAGPVTPAFDLKFCSAGSAATTGVFHVTGFESARSQPVTGLRSIAAANITGTPTLARMGLYKLDADGTATLIASCANDTGLWAVASTAYDRVVTQSGVHIARGVFYYLGFLQVGATQASILAGGGVSASRTTFGNSDRLFTKGLLAAQTDLPASFTMAGLSTAVSLHMYGEVY